MKEKKRGRAVIMAGGPISDYSFYVPQEGDYIICADRGYSHAKALKVCPDILLGDFDSIVQIPEGLKTIRFPAEKDETDLQIAIRHAIDMGFAEIYVIGAFGGRVDHFLGNVCLLHWADSHGIHVTMEDKDTLLMLVSSSAEISRREQHYFSVIPFFGDATVSVSGVKYPLKNKKMIAGDTLGISNEFASPTAHLAVHEGSVLLLLCRADQSLSM